LDIAASSRRAAPRLRGCAASQGTAAVTLRGLHPHLAGRCAAARLRTHSDRRRDACASPALRPCGALPGAPEFSAL